MGDWVEDPAEPSGWRYIPTPPPGWVVYGGHTDHPGPAVTVDVPPRLDGWCEDRPLDELSDADGVE